jgi:predicted dehydrogenase
MGDSFPVTVGIVGAGDIVRAVHLPTLKALPGVRVEWLCDRDFDRARTMSKAYGPPAVELPSDPKDLPAADVVLLATPYGVRRPYYEALRGRGTSIYVEKPFARSAALHREICSWFPEHALASGLMMRVWGPSRVAREAVESELFGRLRRVRFGFGKPGLVTHGRFYFDKQMGGAGMMFEVGIHGIDTVLSLAGAESFETGEVYGVNADDGLDLHTHARATLTSREGRKVDCEITVTSLEETIDGVELEFESAVLSYPLVGQGYALVGQEVDWNVQVRPKSGGRSYRLAPTSGLTPMTKFQMFAEYWKLFLTGIAAREANGSCAIQSLLTTDFIESLQLARREGLAA